MVCNSGLRNYGWNSAAAIPAHPQYIAYYHQAAVAWQAEMDVEIHGRLGA